MRRNKRQKTLITLSLTALAMLVPGRALAHCDTMDGPVVKAAQSALDKRDVNQVLMWVHKPAESEIQQAFDRTLAVRGLGGKAKELADQYFFETLVRVHRAGEGAPYTGLKPAGTALAPAIQEADKALEHGSVEKLAKQITDEASAGLRQRFAETQNKKAGAVHNVEAGREFVAAYVEYVHYAEGLHQAATKGGAHSDGGQEPKSSHEEQQASVSKHNH